ncbi:MAG TPA: SPOR domain-containing protein, partial [Alphaproteobacteria bacterium]
ILAEQSMALKAQAMGQTVQMATAAPRTPVARADLPAGGGPGDGGASVRPVAAVVPEPVATAAPVATEERPAPVTTDEHATGIYVQAGSFTVERNAERLRRELARLAPARVTVADVDGTHYYRVRLGPVASVAEGNRLLATVISTGHSDARIVID